MGSFARATCTVQFPTKKTKVPLQKRSKNPTVLMYILRLFLSQSKCRILRENRRMVWHLQKATYHTKEAGWECVWPITMRPNSFWSRLYIFWSFLLCLQFSQKTNLKMLLSALAYTGAEIFRSFFGRIEKNKKPFGD